jgi:hypothetical protein
MDTDRFDAFARSLGRSAARRRVVAGLALSPLAGFVAKRSAGDVAAKKKRKKHKKAKKPQLNAYGCLNVGQPCNGDNTLCCSGVCEGTAPKKGKKDSSRCAAHDAAICRGPESDTCSTGVAHYCSSNTSCGCLLTTGNAGFCYGTTFECRDCSRDTDCQDEFGLGAACVVLGGICEDLCPDTSGTACALPCPVE